MSDNKTDPDELKLPEGEHHELLGESTELFEITAPEESILLDVVDEKLFPLFEGNSLIADNAIETPQIIITPPSVGDISSSVSESPDISLRGGIEEIDPALFDSFTDSSVISASHIEVTPSDIPASPIVVTTQESGHINTTVPQSELRPTVTKTKSHKTIIIGGIIGILAIAGGILVWAMKNQETTAQPQIDVQYTLSAEMPATYEEVVQDQVQEDTNNIILMNRALTESDAGVCQGITSPDMQLQCRESLFARELSSSGTLADCQILTLSDIRATCESALSQKEALTSMDKSLCSAIRDEGQSQYCREAIDEKRLINLLETKTATPSICQSLETVHQSACLDSITVSDDNGILQRAVQEDNLEVCKQLSTQDLQYICYDTILLKRALVKKDTGLCDYVRDATKKATCMSYTSAQDDNTVFKSAILDKDLTACRTIQTASLKDRCLDSVTILIARDTKDASLCNTLINTGSIDSCKKSAGVQ